MEIAYLVTTIVLAAIAAFSGVGKLRHNPQIVHVVNEVVGVPLQYFPLLAACEIAGAAGLVLGIWWPFLGAAASVGLAVYFMGAVVAHLRVSDAKGTGPASFLLMLSVAAVILSIVSHKTATAQ